MHIRLHPDAAQPLYVQLIHQIRHAIDVGALRHGDQLPGIRTLAQRLVVSAATVAKAYSLLEHERIIELRQGSGAFVCSAGAPSQAIERAQARIRGFVAKLRENGLTDGQIQRLFEAELLYRGTAVAQR